MTTPLTTSELLQGLKKGDNGVLSKAITLIESSRSNDRAAATELLREVLPLTGGAFRIGITGVPGAGKSTFIEAFGQYLTNAGKKVAVLAIDPSSTVTKGSILADKTRMPGLSRDPRAFIRPSSAGESAGGTAARTRETLLLCEAAGFDIILVETVGVGQSEDRVKHMVDFFLLLLPPGSGDELQGMKRGIMEMADGFVITKADGDLLKAATSARAAYQQAVHLMPPSETGWSPPVLTCSAMEEKGVDDVWSMLSRFYEQALKNGNLASRRQQQNISWFQDQFNGLVLEAVKNDPALMEARKDLESKLARNSITPSDAAMRLWEMLKKRLG